jgi:hypothetical protein
MMMSKLQPLMEQSLPASNFEIDREKEKAKSNHTIFFVSKKFVRDLGAQN